MAGLLVLLFLVVPLLELLVIIEVGQAVGALQTVGLLVLMSVAGAWLVRREGLGVWRRMQGQLAAGRAPAGEVVDGFLILLGGALMLTPGFLTDAVGLALLVPPLRAGVRRAARHRLKILAVGRSGEGRPAPGDDGVIDV